MNEADPVVGPPRAVPMTTPTSKSWTAVQQSLSRERGSLSSNEAFMEDDGSKEELEFAMGKDLGQCPDPKVVYINVEKSLE